MFVIRAAWKGVTVDFEVQLQHFGREPFRGEIEREMLGKGGWSQPRGGFWHTGGFQLARDANPVLGMPSACAHSHSWAHASSREM